MLVFPNCKINLGLHIIRKRNDGYHELETVFYPLQVRDALEILKWEVGSRKYEEQPVQFSMTGLPVQGNSADNLCVKAYHLLQKDFPQLPAIQMHLHKAIPMGAGLGGGSADGAFTLQLLNNKFSLGLNQQQLLDYALQLGSDCPFFIINQPCLGTGRGELLQPVSVDLSGYSFLLVHPGIHINTGWAFSQLSPASTHRAVPLERIIQQPAETWRSQLINDFEEPVCSHHPALAAIKDRLYAAGALYATMTGSGSSFYGIFPKKQLPSISWPDNYAVFNVD
jgi:4-diphosphocytidyl-2-C-methyl-D-erythritol kinase